MSMLFTHFKTRFRVVFFMVLVLVGLSMTLRSILFVASVHQFEVKFLTVGGILFWGLFYDLVNASYFLIPIVLYLWIVPERFFRTRIQNYVLSALLVIGIALLMFSAVAEWFFWDEFNSRFNFIAVDYLVYTTEVLGNIRQSYPVEAILAGIAIASGLVVWKMQPLLKLSHPEPIRSRASTALVLLALPVAFYFTVNNKYHRFANNEYVNELSGNGMYELFSAYLNNELNYEQFYTRMEPSQMLSRLRRLLPERNASFALDDHGGIERTVQSQKPERHLNVVLITVESLSANFLGAFGSDKHITPNLDSLASRSMLFTNAYATGTRTVRGLEALSVGLPPLPGQSIVRRPHNENLFSLATVFNSKGYESKFIYGGYGYFDNMNYFFAHNGYEVIDRTALKDDEIDYENIWGVADENLFALAEREIEKTYQKGKPVFAHIMTTSNHRPFTYPDGRIDIPSHTGRAGAVKYTDFAIGKFMKDVSKRPWFNNTLFVIVADHCASSAGKTELPVEKYHIPLMIFSPGNITPSRIERPISQIDIGPTIFGLLNFSYASKGFGYDLFALEEGRERIFISTYQHLGYLVHGELVILSPMHKAQAYLVNPTGTTPLSPMDSLALEDAITWYQGASYALGNNLLHSDLNR